MSNKYGLPIFSWFIYNRHIWKNDIYLMCTLFVNLYVLLTWGPHMVYMGTPYIFDIYIIRCGWLGIYFKMRHLLNNVTLLANHVTC